MKHHSVLVLLIFSMMACRQSKVNWQSECANRFPIKTDTFRSISETIKYDTILLSGKPIVYVDTIKCPPSQHETVVSKKGLLVCPTEKRIIETRWKYDSVVIYQHNATLEKYLKSRLEIEQKQRQILEKKLRMRTLSNVISWALLLIVGLILYYGWKHNH